MSNFEKTPLDDEEIVLETQISCALVFKASLREFREIKTLLKNFSKKITYQRISIAPLWIVLKSEALKE